MLKIGIVGLPNVGKSTLFNSLLKKQVALAANYPFATIEPNVGVVEVPDERLEKLADVIASGHPELVSGSQGDSGSGSGMTPRRPSGFEGQANVKRPPIVPAAVEFVDIAGLVAGASKGEGLGNKFLAHIREVDLIAHVVRNFEDSDILHVSNTIDPKSDMAIIEEELQLADLATFEKQREPKGNATKEAIKLWELSQTVREKLNQGTSVRDQGLVEEEIEILKPLNLLTAKPVLYCFNSSLEQMESAKGEKNKLYFNPLVDESVDRLIQQSYSLLGLISYLTAGEKEVRAWTIKSGTLAPQAAGVIHTDFEKKFIKAEVVPYEIFVSLGGWQKSREAGKALMAGKDYEMKDGDVVDFKIGA